MSYIYNILPHITHKVDSIFIYRLQYNSNHNNLLTTQWAFFNEGLLALFISNYHSGSYLIITNIVDLVHFTLNGLHYYSTGPFDPPLQPQGGSQHMQIVLYPKTPSIHLYLLSLLFQTMSNRLSIDIHLITSLSQLLNMIISLL